ncbi:hypothetical protein ACX12E_15490 [Paenibacillus vandeheii]
MQSGSSSSGDSRRLTIRLKASGLCCPSKDKAGKPGSRPPPAPPSIQNSVTPQ